MAVEGIFRKNGNIRVLQELVEDIDNNPNGRQVQGETNSIQLAALFKKFLRSLPDPLLTHKLYRLFIYSQSKLDSREKACFRCESY
jgi:RhoGAP domain